MLFAVIMAGGRGTRFWPRSRGAMPKQLLDITGESTMLQQTVERIAPLVPLRNILIVTGAEQAARRSRTAVPNILTITTTPAPIIFWITKISKPPRPIATAKSASATAASCWIILNSPPNCGTPPLRIWPAPNRISP